MEIYPHQKTTSLNNN